MVTLRQLLNLAGPDFVEVDVVATKLGVRSTRMVEKLLQKIQACITTEEADLLRRYCDGEIVSCDKDVFPKLLISPNLEECGGFFLDSGKKFYMDFKGVNGKTLYKLCVKCFNKKALNRKIDTPWRTVLGLDEVFMPNWKTFYKPPLIKKIGDLQWRILHCIIAVNAFISVLNPNVSQQCPFCSHRETVFHAFMHCYRLKPLFEVLKKLFELFGETFSMQNFIFGVKYSRRRQRECQLLNFILGKSKMAIYISRKDKIEQNQEFNLVSIFRAMVKSRLLIDFSFYKATSCIEMFENIWCFGGVLCSVVDNELYFTQLM